MHMIVFMVGIKTKIINKYSQQMKKLFLITILLFLVRITIFGQNVQFPRAIVSAGGSNFYNALSPVFLSRWRIGAINILTIPNTDNGLKVATIGSPQEDLSTGWSVAVYPNPVRDFLKVKFEKSSDMNFTIEMTDMTGRKLSTKRAEGISAGQTEEYDLTGFVPGMYLLRVIPDDQSGHRLFKVIKN